VILRRPKTSWRVTLAETLARVGDSLGVMNRAEPLLAPGTAKRRMKSVVEFHEFWLLGGPGHHRAPAA
jgi:hypothetical protein